LGKCTGCRTCQSICALVHESEMNHELARIQVAKDDKNGICVSIPCSQCSKAACVEVCPMGANAYVPATGANVIDPDRCIGCQMCMMVCPIGAVSKIERHGQNLIVKCDLCNGDPQCVKYCESGAIRFEEPQEVVDKHSNAFSEKIVLLLKEMKGIAGA
jgi:anaerobic carbon-monoxide dehydrogenase iron sulfur subunit